jgi:hypothetical protein
MKSEIVPNGCRYCGLDYQGHCQRWHPDAAVETKYINGKAFNDGWHAWIQPTQEQIKQRMLARRALRINERR